MTSFDTRSLRKLFARANAKELRKEQSPIKMYLSEDQLYINPDFVGGLMMMSEQYNICCDDELDELFSITSQLQTISLNNSECVDELKHAKSKFGEDILDTLYDSIHNDERECKALIRRQRTLCRIILNALPLNSELSYESAVSA